MDQYTQISNDILSNISMYNTIYEAGNLSIEEFFKRVKIEEIQNQVEEASRNKTPLSPLVNGIYDFYLACQSKKKTNPIQFYKLKDGISELSDLHKSIEEAKQNAEQHIITITQEYGQTIQKIKQEAEIDKQQEISELKAQNLQYSQALKNIEIDKKLYKGVGVQEQIQQLIEENKQLKGKKRKREKLEKEKLELEEKVRILGEEKENVISRYKKSLSAKDNMISAKDKMISTRNKKIDELNNTIEELNKKNKNSSFFQTIQSNPKKSSSNNIRVETLEKQIFSQQEEIQRLNTQVDYLRRELKNVAIKGTSEINQENQLPDQNIDASDQNIKSSKNTKQQDEIKVLKAEIKNLQITISQKDSDINNLTQSTLNKGKQLEKVINDFNLQIDEINKKYSLLNQLYENAKSNNLVKDQIIQNFAKEKETYVNQIKNQEQLISSFKGENYEMRRSYDRMKNENTYIKGENDRMKDENALIKNENEKVKKENTDVKSDNEKLKKENIDIKSDNEKLKKENIDIKSDNEKLKEKNDKLNAKLNNKIKSKIALENESLYFIAQEQEKLIAKLEEENSDLNKQIEELRNTSEKQLEDISNITRENNGLKERVTDLEEILQTQENKINSINKEKTNIETQVKKLKEDITELEKIKNNNVKLIKYQKEIINKQMILAKIENEKQIRRMKEIQQREIDSILEVFSDI